MEKVTIKYPKVSIIVPIYNTSKYLEKCLNSLVNQDYKNLEIIVVEDFSTDNSKELLKKYDKYNNIKIIYNKENKGLACSRNIGIKKATGKYISFIDSDDYIEKNFYSTMVNKIIETKSKIAICGIKVVYENENNKEIINLCSDPKKTKEGYINNGLAASACNKIFEKKLFDKYNFEDGKLNEDIAVVIPLIVETDEITYVDNIYYYYIQRDKSIQNSQFSLKRFDIFDGVKLALERIKNCDNYENIKEIIIYNQIINLLFFGIANEKNRKTRNKLLKKYKELSKEYDLKNNKYYKEYIKKCNIFNKIYYTILLKTSTNIYQLSNIMIGLKNMWRAK